MDHQQSLRIIVLIVLLFLSAFFSSAETAFTTVNKIRIKNLSDNGNKRALLVLKILDDPSKMLSTILVGNNIVNLSASSIATTLAIDIFGSLGAGIATFFVTFFILIFGEISPKTLATLYSNELSLAFCRIIYLLEILLFPAVYIVNVLSGAFLSLFRIDTTKKEENITEGELKTIVDVSHKDGVIEEGERDMIYNLFHFNDTYAREIMVPRIDMISVEDTADIHKVMDLYRESLFTRIPVYHKSNDNITGFINMKDILLYAGDTPPTLKSILRTPYYTHERKNTAELMLEMRAQKINIAIVLDEYGSAAGMITMEDLLEEIVGEIRDEFDEDESDAISKISDNEYEVDGLTNIDDINDVLSLSLDSKDYETIGGFVIGLSDTFPEKGASYTLSDDTKVRVISIENNRIDRLLLTLPKEKPSKEEITESSSD